jgi:hypothetical protein
MTLKRKAWKLDLRLDTIPQQVRWKNIVQGTEQQKATKSGNELVTICRLFVAGHLLLIVAFCRF